MTTTLFIIATPIGNLSDVSARAKEILKTVQVILCEDTRVTKKLLNHFEIHTSVLRFDAHAPAGKMETVLSLLREGKNLALVTDAGTPGISDPGGKLVEAVWREFGDQVSMIPIPGPAALAVALSISGFPADRFVFLGFPPHKKGRKTFFDELAKVPFTVVFYESVHRIEKTLAELLTRIGDRPVVLCRELTKLHETIYRGTVRQVTAALRADTIKGEFVMVVGPKFFGHFDREKT
jgi:16S rRNA (cytidine1402-2'-O)-methyltransferase